MNRLGDAKHYLGTIQESGQSDPLLVTASEDGSPRISSRTTDEPVDIENLNSDSEGNEEGEDEEEFVYPGATSLAEAVAAPPMLSHPSRPSPAQLESLFAAASSGDLPLLKKLFKNAQGAGVLEAFSLANDASPRTGSTALHTAASRGHLDIVTWLVEDCGAMPDLEDREGETALHRAALNGHLSIVQFLLIHKVNIRAQDADGWTALHNACSKGYLDIVRCLCERGGPMSEMNDIHVVDVRSRDGWTPLMNASSKGHLPVVLYLLNKQSADPLIRNKWGETAYDIAAAVFEVWICEVLQQAEADRWRDSQTLYNPLAVHTTLPVIVYENQRLDIRLKTVAVSGGRPRFSASGLGRRGRRPPFEIKSPRPESTTSTTVIATWRSDVQLPLRDAPWTLPLPKMPERQSTERGEKSHFWLSDWNLDVTHPGVDAESGWQYAHYFSDSDDQWTAEKPPLLERLLNGGGVVASSSRTPQAWVRRRRWVRIMRRRIDIPPLPFLKPDGGFYHLIPDGSLVPYTDRNLGELQNDSGQELELMASTVLSSAQDYVARARYLVGKHINKQDSHEPITSAVDARRSIAKLERATMELRQGILGDEESDRKTQAEVLLNAYSRELERLRLAATAQGMVIVGEDGAGDESLPCLFPQSPTDNIEHDEDSSDEEFHYPGAPREDSQSISRASTSTRHTTIPRVPSVPTDLAPQLSQAPDFRVPTNETPQKVLMPRWSSPVPHQRHALWERDEAVTNCRDCLRRFSLLTRRHVCIPFSINRQEWIAHILISIVVNVDESFVTVVHLSELS
ncbi:hypothetical protein AX17_001165 [Amanita inopinata Kibby_2008]|nr:hypothetical protein AX17_001165 [Amanita inopinata Kibby_2008]